jgi:hypothetical protein
MINPIYTRGNKKDVSNYISISVLTTCSIIFEKAMQSRLLKLLHNNILCREQYGFQIKLTTENATYKLINEILSVWNNKLREGDIFCDLEKAFDCVYCNKLISKLETYRMTYKELYQSYCKGRYQ